MPWSPTFEYVEPDPRLDPYRGRAAQMTRDGAAVGHLLVETEYLQVRTGGFAWWRRWGPPQEFAVVSVLVDGESPDPRTFALDELTEALDDWTRGRHRGHTEYGLTWLDQQDSDRVHQEVFRHHH